jgi:hypothetical protein
MMTPSNFVPDVARLEKAIAESRETRKALEIVSLELDELLLTLEQQNLQQRKQRLQGNIANEFRVR